MRYTHYKYLTISASKCCSLSSSMTLTFTLLNGILYDQHQINTIKINNNVKGSEHRPNFIMSISEFSKGLLVTTWL